jgi:hypothetical protein
MKKNNNRLVLRKEHLRALLLRDLKLVVGGTTHQSDLSDCCSSECSCDCTFPTTTDDC